jgi:CheY-like chemotaxis protein
MRRLAEEKPDLILMDVVMPGPERLPADPHDHPRPAFADVPVIMCTSKNQETDKVWGMRQGARDYVVKPVDADELDRRSAPSTEPARRSAMANKEALRELQSGWPSACSGAPQSSEAARGWRSNARARACMLPLRAGGRDLRPGPLVPVPHTRPGSSAWPTCAVACSRRGRPGRLPGPAPGSAGTKAVARFNRATGGLQPGPRPERCVLLVDRLAGLRSEDNLQRADERRTACARPALCAARAGATAPADSGRNSTSPRLRRRAVLS